MDNIEEILLSMRDAFAKALVPVTMITFIAIMALCPLYITMGFITRQMQTKVN